MNNAPFYVGQRVVCVDNDFPNFLIPKLKVGRLYTVSGFSPIYPGITLGEVPEVCEDDNLVWSYAYRHFAPVDEIEYKDVTKQLAVLPTDEVPDVKEIKELVN